MGFSWPFEFGSGEMNVSDALGVVITGFTVVFLVLILLVIVFALMGKFFTPTKKEEKKEIKKEAPIKTETVLTASKNDNSLIAAITAALHEYLGNGNFVIKKIRPLKIGKKTTDAWHKSGRAENTRPF
jgi:sodium pump decarboxylase gamma subunit